jgi:hypothetical protein
LLFNWGIFQLYSWPSLQTVNQVGKRWHWDKSVDRYFDWYKKKEEKMNRAGNYALKFATNDWQFCLLWAAAWCHLHERGLSFSKEETLIKSRPGVQIVLLTSSAMVITNFQSIKNKTDWCLVAYCQVVNILFIFRTRRS